MKVILVGNHAPSQTYTRNKKKFCERFGAQCDIIKLPEDINENNFIKEVAKITEDNEVHGCFIQLPLPKHLEHINIAELIPPHKDIDGFTKENLVKILKGDTGETALIPCTPKGVITLLDYYDIPIEGKNIIMIGRSLIVGKPLSLLLTNRHATVTICHSRTKNLPEITKRADIIICAIGKPKFLNKSHLPEDGKNKTIIIDVGVEYDVNGNLLGDVDFDDVKDNVLAITPVPGGIGPMTILSLAQNLLQAAEKSL